MKTTSKMKLSEKMKQPQKWRRPWKWRQHNNSRPYQARAYTTLVVLVGRCDFVTVVCPFIGVLTQLFSQLANSLSHLQHNLSFNLQIEFVGPHSLVFNRLLLLQIVLHNFFQTSYKILYHCPLLCHSIVYLQLSQFNSLRKSVKETFTWSITQLQTFKEWLELINKTWSSGSNSSLAWFCSAWLIF